MRCHVETTLVSGCSSSCSKYLSISYFSHHCDKMTKSAYERKVYFGSWFEGTMSHTHPGISRDGLDWPLRNEGRTVACTGKLGLERKGSLMEKPESCTGR